MNGKSKKGKKKQTKKASMKEQSDKWVKDADELNISLPVKGQKPNYELMETLISAIQKLVIK